MACQIHPQAVVDPAAELGTDVVIGPFTIVGPHVKLGDRTRLHGHCWVGGHTSIGEETEVFPFATVGVKPQDLKYRGEPSCLEIGARNQIREYANFSIGTEDGGGLTRVGDDNLFMVYTHVAHDCIVGSRCIFANNAQLGGHVEVHDRAVLGAMSGMHQFVRVGELAMVAAGSMVAQDVVPFCMVAGDRAAVSGLNIVGLRRAEVTGSRLSHLKSMFRLLFRQGLSLEEAVQRIAVDIPDTPEKQLVLGFFSGEALKRGVCR